MDDDANSSRVGGTSAAVTAARGGAVLPDLTGALTAAANTALIASLSALTPDGSMPNLVSVAGGGSAGPTAIESGLGNHTLVAGTGSTLFGILAGTPNRAITIGNFDAAQDFVQLQGYAARAAAAALMQATLVDGNEVLSLPDGTSITFQGVASLKAGSFI